MGETLRWRLPSGTEVSGPVIYKAVEADFATQRDVSRTKRDIKTVAIRVRVSNPQGKLAAGHDRVGDAAGTGHAPAPVNSVRTSRHGSDQGRWHQQALWRAAGGG